MVTRCMLYIAVVVVVSVIICSRKSYGLNDKNGNKNNLANDKGFSKLKDTLMKRMNNLGTNSTPGDTNIMTGDTAQPGSVYKKSNTLNNVAKLLDLIDIKLLGNITDVNVSELMMDYPTLGKLKVDYTTESKSADSIDWLTGALDLNDFVPCYSAVILNDTSNSSNSLLHHSKQSAISLNETHLQLSNDSQAAVNQNDTTNKPFKNTDFNFTDHFENKIQQMCSNQNLNFRNLYENKKTINNIVSTMTEYQQELTGRFNQFLNFTTSFTHYDKSFKEILLKNEDTLSNNIQIIVKAMQGIMIKLRQMEENQDQLALQITTKELQDKIALDEIEQVAPANLDYKVTKSTCNAQRQHLHGESCYYVPRVQAENMLYSWWDARYHCKEKLGNKADLVTLDTKEEMHALTFMLRNHFGDIDEFWLGASNLGNKRRWKWVNNVTLDMNTLNDWGSTLILHNEDNCMAMYGTFQFHGEPCFYERYPVCEINLKDEEQ